MNGKTVVIAILIAASCTSGMYGCSNSTKTDKNVAKQGIEIKEKDHKEEFKTQEEESEIPDGSLGMIKELFPDDEYAQSIANVLEKEISDYVTEEELSGIKGDCIFPGEMKSIEGIGYLTGIEEFNCCKNQVREIPAEIGNCKKLKSFDICKAYSLSKIPKELFDCTEISYMRMFMSGIDELPKEIGQLKKLECLLCSYGTKLPKEIGQLENLKELACESTHIPKEVKDLKNLEYLNINSSKVDEFIEHIGELKNLKRLDLGGCNLKEFPMGILQLENLERLNLFGNDIRKIPKEIGNLKKLEYINTYDNYNLDEDYKQYLANEELRNN